MKILGRCRGHRSDLDHLRLSGLGVGHYRQPPLRRRTVAGGPMAARASSQKTQAHEWCKPEHRRNRWSHDEVEAYTEGIHPDGVERLAR